MFFVRGGLWFSMLIAGLFAAPAGFGQSSLPTPPATVEDALHAMSDAAGVIFAGQVVRVLRIGGEPGSLGTVQVDFQVENAIRGCVSGQSVTLREWAGLWGAAEVRYRVGQRMLMLLRIPGAAGLSSPVGGMDGAIPIRGVVSQLVSGSTAGSASLVPATEMVDLRWVGATTLRSSASTDAAVTAQSGVTSSPSTASVAAQGASVDTVLGMLADWEKVRLGAQ
jgi:hypothetical protein